MCPRKRYCHWFTAQRGHRLESWDRIRHEGRRCLTLLLGFEVLHKSNKQTTAWLQGRGSETAFSPSTRLNIWLLRWTLYNYVSALLCVRQAFQQYVQSHLHQSVVTWRNARYKFRRHTNFVVLSLVFVREVLYIYIYFRLKPEAKHLSRETDENAPTNLQKKASSSDVRNIDSECLVWIRLRFFTQPCTSALKTTSHAWKQNQREMHDTDFFFSQPIQMGDDSLLVVVDNDRSSQPQLL